MKKTFFIPTLLLVSRQKFFVVILIIFLFASCSSQSSQKSSGTSQQEYVFKDVQWQPASEDNVYTSAISLINEVSPVESRIVSIKINQRGTYILAANFKSMNREYWYQVKGKIIYLFWNTGGFSNASTDIKVTLKRK